MFFTVSELWAGPTARCFSSMPWSRRLISHMLVNKQSYAYFRSVHHSVRERQRRRAGRQRERERNMKENEERYRAWRGSRVKSSCPPCHLSADCLSGRINMRFSNAGITDRLVTFTRLQSAHFALISLGREWLESGRIFSANWNGQDFFPCRPRDRRGWKGRYIRRTEISPQEPRTCAEVLQHECSSQLGPAWLSLPKEQEGRIMPVTDGSVLRLDWWVLHKQTVHSGFVFFCVCKTTRNTWWEAPTWVFTHARSFHRNTKGRLIWSCLSMDTYHESWLWLFNNTQDLHCHC